MCTWTHLNIADMLTDSIRGMTVSLSVIEAGSPGWSIEEAVCVLGGRWESGEGPGVFDELGGAVESFVE